MSSTMSKPAAQKAQDTGIRLGDSQVACCLCVYREHTCSVGPTVPNRTQWGMGKRRGDPVERSQPRNTLEIYNSPWRHELPQKILNCSFLKMIKCRLEAGHLSGCGGDSSRREWPDVLSGRSSLRYFFSSKPN